jgi:hypothetical protein
MCNVDNDGINTVVEEFNDPFEQGWREDLMRFGSLPDVQDIVEAYPTLWERGFGVNEGGRTLKESIEMESWFIDKNVMLQLIMDKDEACAVALNDALDDIIACKDTIMMVISSRSGWGRSCVADKYQEMYGESLGDALTNKLGEDGEFAQVARDMFQSLSQRMADYCYIAMHGSTSDEAQKLLDSSKRDNMGESVFRTGMLGNMGTDEQRLSRTILYASKGELAAIMRAYEKKFGKCLMKEVYSETGGDFRAMLMYKFRRTQTGLLHVQRKKLIRCDDMPSNFPIDAVSKMEIFGSNQF